MTELQCLPNRRKFFNAAAAISAGVSGSTLLPESAVASDERINIIGPKPEYSPQVGTLVSMLSWMQTATPRAVGGLKEKDLDHLFDSHANTIGALLLHLAATETYYQMNTFEAMRWVAGRTR